MTCGEPRRPPKELVEYAHFIEISDPNDIALDWTGDQAEEMILVNEKLKIYTKTNEITVDI